jgi:hypothetical protein
MNPDPIVIFPGDHGWRIASPGGVDELQFERDVTPDQIAEAVSATLRNRGYRAQGVLLALPSTWCLAARISMEGLTADDRGAWIFRLEEKLPLAAESFTADFVAVGEGALGVCVANDRLAPLIGALEGRGVVIQSVSPAVMLAIQSQSREEGQRTVLWGEGDRVSVVTLASGRPATWALVESAPESIRLQLATLGASSNPPHAYDLRPGLMEEARPRPETIDRAVLELAPDVLSGRVRPWFELRRGAMAADDPLRVVRGSVNAALVAAIALCAVLSAVFLFRASRYERLARSYEGQAAAEFRKQFPGWPVPANVRAVVESERRRLSLAGGSSLPAEARSSALRVMTDVLTKLPPDLRIAVDRMAFHDGGLELEGRARANGDVDVIVSAVRSAGMDTPPPQLRKTGDGAWSFTVRGTRPVESAPRAAAGGGE